MRLISIFSYNIASRFNDILSIYKLFAIFPEQNNLFRIVKNYMNDLNSILTLLFQNFPLNWLVKVKRVDLVFSIVKEFG